MAAVGTASDRDGAGGTRHVALDPAFVESTITTRFDEAVARHADRVAIRDLGGEITYRALARRVGSLADALTEAGLRPGEPAALLVDQGLDAVTSVLAVLRAGGAFAPLDVVDPPARAGRLMELAGAQVVVTSGVRATQAGDVAASMRNAAAIVVADEHVHSTRSGAAVAALPSSPASVFFTSGSTGTPKAVLDLHRNVLHNVLRYTNLLELSAADRLSLVQRPSFSGIASSLFGALLNGATLCTYGLTPDTVPGLADWVRDERVTVFHSVPAIFRALVAGGGSFPDVRVVRLEGDRASWADVARFRRCFSEHAMLANGLGTTETGLAAQFRVTRDVALGQGLLPVGTPAPDMEIVLLDEEGRASDDGAGEIGVRSRFLAAGYLGAPALTDGRFLASGDEARLYRTGDLGRLGPDGLLEVVGRVDGSAKVAGSRVEPAEVEAALLRVPGVAEAVVVVEPARGGGGRLAARVVAESPELDEAAVREELASLLPAFMVPSRIDLVGDLCVDANWKVSRAPSRAPVTPLEQSLLDIWRDVLEVEAGVDDRFVDLGGDSLAAAEVSAAIEQRLGLDAPLSLLARAPTVERLAAALSAPEAVDVVELVVLTDDAPGTPLVLLPGHHGRSVMYSRLAATLRAPGPVWAIEIPASGADLTVPEVAERAAATIRDAAGDAPVVVGGFCYGALLAIEVVRSLRSDGHEVLPVLLGLEPVDLPELVSPDALARWKRDVGSRRLSVARVRHHLREARAAGGAAGLRYAAAKVRKAAKHGLRTVQGRRRATELQRGAAAYRPGPLPGAAVMILGDATAAKYTDDPAGAWAGLADTVDVVVLPGVAGDSALLKAQVGQLADALSHVLAGVDAQTEP